MNFLDALHDRPLVADGAMGTMINASGVGFERSFEALNLVRGPLIEGIHRAFVAAGADIIETNTFAATEIHLERWGVARQVADINATAVRLAKSAASEADRPIYVAGSVGPTGARLAPVGPLGLDEARRAFASQISTLAEAGVDLLVLETFADLDELAIAVAAARSVCALPIIASMTFNREVRTTSDVVPEVAAARLRALGVDVIGANCSTGPRGVFEVLSHYRSAIESVADSALDPVADSEVVPEGTRVPAFAAMPNAGYPESRGARLFFPAPPDYFEEYTRKFLAAGARIIGGCCGTTPDHIVGVRRAVDAYIADPRSVVAEPATARPVGRRSTDHDGVVASLAPTTHLARALAAGQFVTTVEMEPPKGTDTSALEANALRLRDAGATLLNISDTPMARMRMTGLAAAVKVQRATGLETVLHFPVRGRNLLRVQGDLLAAHALDARNLFVTMGDLASIGDYPQAFDHHDIVPTGLVRLIKQKFNQGTDSANTSIGQPCSFVVGVAVNLTAQDVKAEAKLLKRKIDFGADFALTQPVFEPTAALAFIERYEAAYGPLALPLLLGVLPLASVRHAVFLRNEVPGMSVPEWLVTRMGGVVDDGRAEGRRIASEMLITMRPRVQGAYFIPSFKRYDVIASLIEEHAHTAG